MSVCSKLKCFQMVVANFYNSSKKYNEFANVSISKVSRELESFKRECLSISSPREWLLSLVPFRVWSLINGTNIE